MKQLTYPEMPPMSWASVESVARDTLGAVFRNEDDFFSRGAMLRLFEGGLMEPLGIGYGVEELPFGEDAYFNFDTDEIILAPHTYDGLGRDDGRPRFTLAHEIGHGVLHREFMRSVGRGNSRATRLKRTEILPYRDPECQANRFASEFLMPTHFVKSLVEQGAGPTQVASKFKTSFSAASIKCSEFTRRKPVQNSLINF